MLYRYGRELGFIWRKRYNIPAIYFHNCVEQRFREKGVTRRKAYERLRKQ